MLIETLLEILKSQELPPPPNGEVERDLLPALEPVQGMATVITGIRRSGKSTLQTQLARHTQTPFYCNFEDTRLLEMTTADLPRWLAAFEKLNPNPTAVFLDEVQEIKGWQNLVRALLDKGHSLCVTGSNASILNAELGRKLTGRHLSHSVFPFNYSEYLRFTGQARDETSLKKFLDDGGFPLYLASRRDEVLRSLLRDVVQRDIILRHRLRETRSITNLLLFLFANTGMPYSFHHLTKNFDIPAVAKTSEYLEFLQDAYLLFAVPKFSHSFKKRIVAPPKYYAIDNGLRRANSTQSTPDYGRRLENAVALDLLRKGEAPTYASEINAWECDFVTRDTVYQVCWELTEENLSRELRGLVEAQKLTHAPNAVILSRNQQQTLTHNDMTVQVIPVWNWLAASRQ
jgi:predicted AAA+ superfamily ATPase